MSPWCNYSGPGVSGLAKQRFTIKIQWALYSNEISIRLSMNCTFTFLIIGYRLHAEIAICEAIFPRPRFPASSYQLHAQMNRTSSQTHLHSAPNFAALSLSVWLRTLVLPMLRTSKARRSYQSTVFNLIQNHVGGEDKESEGFRF